jgi:hypothetical protein
VALIRKLNPGVPIHGLFGGGQRSLRLLGKQLLSLDGVYNSRANPRWNWRHGDLALIAWYRDVGCRLQFDFVHLIEWDLLLLEPLESLYSCVPEGAVGLTALTPISELEAEWTWLRRDANRRQWEALLDHVRGELRYDGRQYGCIAGGACLPRSFLEAYAAVDPPQLCNDELRVPLFAQALGFPIVDTRLRGPWRGERDHALFHFRSQEIELSAIRSELAKPDGWRAFHPVRARIAPEEIFG